MISLIGVHAGAACYKSYEDTKQKWNSPLGNDTSPSTMHSPVPPLYCSFLATSSPQVKHASLHALKHGYDTLTWRASM